MRTMTHRGPGAHHCEHRRNAARRLQGDRGAVTAVTAASAGEGCALPGVDLYTDVNVLIYAFREDQPDHGRYRE